MATSLLCPNPSRGSPQANNRRLGRSDRAYDSPKDSKTTPGITLPSSLYQGKPHPYPIRQQQNPNCSKTLSTPWRRDRGSPTLRKQWPDFPTRQHFPPLGCRHETSSRPTSLFPDWHRVWHLFFQTGWGRRPRQCNGSSPGAGREFHAWLGNPRIRTALRQKLPPGCRNTQILTPPERHHLRSPRDGHYKLRPRQRDRNF